MPQKQYPNRSPWAIPVAQVGSRAGQSLELDSIFPAPSGIGDEFYGVQEGSDIRVEGRFDSIIDGLVFTGTATATMTGECGRCLTDINRDESIDITTFMPYESPAESVRFGSRSSASRDEDVIIAGDEESSDITPLLGGGDFADIEALLRDGFAQSIPVTPLCKPDCRGLCPQCGMNLNEHPDHVHELADFRLADLADFKAKLEAAEKAAQE